MMTEYAFTLSVAAGLLLWGGLTTSTGDWYRALRKPSFQPPAWAFGPAWTLILGLAAVSAVLGWRADAGGRPLLAALFGLNALLHALWSPLFFRVRRPDLALAEMAALFVSVASLIGVLLPKSLLGAAILLPYLCWVGFAFAVNLQIVRLNPRSGAGVVPAPPAGRA